MSVLALTVVASVVLIVLVCVKTKLEHDIESNAIDECKHISKKKTRKKKEKSSNKNATMQEGWFFSKKLVISFTGIIIEIILVILGITGALEFDNYLERKDVLRNVSFAKSYVNETKEHIERILLAYQSGMCDVDDVKINVSIDQAMIEAIIDTAEARRQIKPLAISFVFSSKENIETLILVMNEDTFDDGVLQIHIEEIIYQLDLLVEALSAIENHLCTGKDEQFLASLQDLYNEFDRHTAEVYIPG